MSLLSARCRLRQVFLSFKTSEIRFVSRVEIAFSLVGPLFSSGRSLAVYLAILRYFVTFFGSSTLAGYFFANVKFYHYLPRFATFAVTLLSQQEVRFIAKPPENRVPPIGQLIHVRVHIVSLTHSLP